MGAPKGKKNGNWKGNKANYDAIHQWIRREYKINNIPKICKHCGSDKNIQIANISGNYTRDINDYIPLCVRCHIKFDRDNGRGRRANMETPFCTRCEGKHSLWSCPLNKRKDMRYLVRCPHCGKAL